MSSIIIKCPNCSRQNSVDSLHIGKYAKCGACQFVFLVSDEPQPAERAADNAASQTSDAPSSDYAPSAYAPSAYAPSAYATSHPATLPHAGTTLGQESSPPKFLENLSTAGQTGFRCPFCQANVGLYTREQISTAGWVVFAVLLMSCAPLCWIGLLIKEPTSHCGNCHLRIG